MSLTRVRWRLSLTLLCLFASTFQSSLAQTHSHREAGREPYVALAAHAGDGAAALSISLSPDQSKNHAGGARGDTACPLCQILMFGGGLPTAPFQMPVRSLTAAEHVLLEQVPACFIAAVSYDWQSRGPPRA
jgi:hypothetical protein